MMPVLMFKTKEHSMNIGLNSGYSFLFLFTLCPFIAWMKFIQLLSAM